MRMSPLWPLLPPAIICELMVIAPSDMAVQPAPSAPLARLKLSDAVTVPPLAAQVTATLVTFADPTVPLPLPTVQAWPDGWVSTVTEYAEPLVSFVEIGAQLKRALERRDRSGVVVCLRVLFSEKEKSLDQIGIRVGRLAELGDCRVNMPLLVCFNAGLHVLSGFGRNALESEIQN